MMIWIYIGVSVLILGLLSIILFAVRFHMAKKKAKTVRQLLEAKERNQKMIDEVTMKIDRQKPVKSKYSGRKAYQKVPRRRA